MGSYLLRLFISVSVVGVGSYLLRLFITVSVVGVGVGSYLLRLFITVGVVVFFAILGISLFFRPVQPILAENKEMRSPNLQEETSGK